MIDTWPPLATNKANVRRGVSVSWAKHGCFFGPCAYWTFIVLKIHLKTWRYIYFSSWMELIEFGGKFDPNRFFFIFFCRGGPSLCLWPVGLKSSPVILWILTKKFQTVIAEKATNSNLDADGWHRGARSMVDRFIPLCGPTIFKCLWFLFCKEVPWACFKIGNIQVV